MLLTGLLNACHHFPGFVYEAAHLCEAHQRIEIDVRPRRGSRPRCSGCGRRCSGYDQLPVRRFEFIPIRGFTVVLLYAMRRVQCRGWVSAQVSPRLRAGAHACSPRQSSHGKYAVLGKRSSSRHQTKSTYSPRQCLISGSARII